MTNTLAGQLGTPEDAHRFVFAGNATLTLKSIKTGTHFTYKIEKAKEGPTFFVKLLVGPQNTADYQYLGHFGRSGYTHGTKSKISPEAPGARAFRFFADQLDGLSFHPSLEVWHEGRCGRCGRVLTVPASVASGFGPECADKMGVTLSAA